MRAYLVHPPSRRRRYGPHHQKDTTRGLWLKTNETHDNSRNEDSTLVALRAFAPADLFLCSPVAAENSRGGL